jgi:hypothetical protein
MLESSLSTRAIRVIRGSWNEWIRFSAIQNLLPFSSLLPDSTPANGYRAAQ